jgi:hypothetical protein
VGHKRSQLTSFHWIGNMQIALKLIIAVIMLLPAAAMALPEMARLQKYSCTSCHVNPSGGGMLNTYGREFSEEKLSTWAREGEERFLQGLVPMHDNVFFGGDARWIKYEAKSLNRHVEKFWRMQTDLEAGVHFGPIYVTGMMGTKPAGPNDDQKEHANFVHRGYMVRADLLDEHVVLRGGLFMPRYGLMLADHTAYIRQATGLNPDGAQTQVEAIFHEDFFELSLATLIENSSYDRKAKSHSGYNLGVSGIVGGNNRISASVLSTTKKTSSVEVSMMAMGLSAVVSLTQQLYAMVEIDRVHNGTKTSTVLSHSEAIVDFATLNYEAYKGLIPYVRYEFIDTDMNRPDTSTSRMGAGVNWYPRPHAQFELRVLQAKSNASKSTTNSTEGLLHYYF